MIGCVKKKNIVKKYNPFECMSENKENCCSETFVRSLAPIDRHSEKNVWTVKQTAEWDRAENRKEEVRVWCVDNNDDDDEDDDNVSHKFVFRVENFS